jgi:hypothetical protein
MQDTQSISTEELVNQSLKPSKFKEHFDLVIALFIFSLSVYGAFELTKYLTVSLVWRIVFTVGYFFAVMFFSLGLSKKG